MCDAETLTRALGGTWYRTYGVACCPAHENRNTPALSLADGENGRLLAKCHGGCDFRSIMAALRARGLTSDRPAPANGRTSAPQPAPRTDDGGKMEIALRIWRAARPIEGTLSARYLAHRAVSEPTPLSLRHGRGVWHPGERRKRPALVAAMTLEGVGIVGVHRTWLKAPGRKCGVEPVRAMLGPVSGAAVRLQTGDGALYVGEGIESTLSLRDRFAGPRDRLWAVGPAAGFHKLVLPPTPGELVLALDNDRSGRRGGMTLARRARDAGWTLLIIKPPGPGLDWNDIAMSKASVL